MKYKISIIYKIFNKIKKINNNNKIWEKIYKLLKNLK